MTEYAYWNSITENDKLYEFELKPEVDLASASISSIEDNLFGILIAVDRVVYPD